MLVSKRGNTQGVLLIVALVVICGYFILQEGGITGAVIGVEENPVDQKIEVELQDNEEVPVIIELETEENKDLETIKKEIKETQKEILEDLNSKDQPGIIFTSKKDFEVDKKFTTINAISGKVTKEGLKKLKKDKKVKKVSYDYPIKPFLSSSVPVIKANQVWTYQVNNITIDGTGETICVIDTGIDYTHSALGNCTEASFLAGTCNKVIGGYDYGDDDNNPKDVHGHGTHVSGIATSEDSTYKGVAPGAKIVSLKVFTDSGYGTTSNALSAIDWCVNNASKFNISVITMSIGVTDNQGNEVPYLNTCDYQDSLAAKASWAASQGLFVDVSSGNTQGSNGITSPACGENVTSVGSTTKSDSISGYNTAPILSVLAPGSSITSTVLNQGFSSKSGTSMAAPHVAGSAALLIQYWKLAYGKTITPLQIQNKFKLTGKMINDTRNGIIFPRIDLLKAIQPIITFSNDSIVDSNSQTETTAFLNITSDVDISTALVEWTYPNQTTRNQSMNQNNNTNFVYTLSNLAVGNHSYFVYGQDSANTLGVSESRTLIIESTLPQIVFYNPLNNTYNNQVQLNISVTHNDLIFSNYSIYDSSGNLTQSNNTLVNNTNYSWLDILNLSDGNYSLVIEANSSTTFNSKQIVFSVDSTLPIISGINQDPQNVYDNGTVNLFVNITDSNLNQLLVEGNWNSSIINYSLSLESNNKYKLTIAATELQANELIIYQFFATDFASNLVASYV